MLRWLRKTVFHANNFLFVITFGVLCAGILVLWFALLDLPDLQSFDERVVRQSTKIYDRTGEVLLYDLHENIQRTVVPYEDISRHIKNATVAIEDSEFYEHNGIKISSTIRAILANLLSAGFSQGGSTITQQVVKNSVLTPEKKISRKLKEWALALKLEQAYSKEEILTLYLNEAPYGGSLYGIEEASQDFFGKSAKDVSIAQAAYLAALPQAPTYYSPYGEHLEDLDNRKDLVLKRMFEEGFITKQEFLDSLKEKVEFQPQQNYGIRAPHFVFYVQQYLEDTYGSRALYEDGLRVVTTLDWDLQQIAERIVKKNALENEEKFNAENAGLVATDPRTGHILVMVGSRDYFDTAIDGNFNITTAHRQPGSAFKPIVYATALEKGYTPETVVFDLKTQFSTRCPVSDTSSDNPCYSPNNYDNIFRGPVTFRNALAQSINIPAVKVLYLVGINDALNMARRVGIRGLNNETAQYGLTLVLGGGEVTPLEMSGAYSVFANDGVRNLPTPIIKIEDSLGNALEQYEPNPQKVMSNNIARQISDILSDNEARTPAFGANSFLNFPSRDVAVKTGTTDNYRDAWIIGYTPSISVASWAGNNDNRSMEKKVAGFIVAPMWREFMDEALAKFPAESFAPPIAKEADVVPVLRGIWEGGETVLIDRISGKLATELTPAETQEERALTNVHSILHWISKENPLGEQPKNPSTDPQYTRWEYPVRLWASSRGLFSGEHATPSITKYDDVHVEKNMPKLSILGIDEEKIYNKDSTVSVSVKSSGKFPLKRVEFYINGQYIDADETNPFATTLNFEEFVGSKNNTLRVVGIDSVFNHTEVIIPFLLNTNL